MTSLSSEPFTSGLPGSPDAAPKLDPRGCALLHAIRGHAEHDVRVLAPLTLRRFDGEWNEPDAEAMLEHERARATVIVVDHILRDIALAASFSALLARMK